MKFCAIIVVYNPDTIFLKNVLDSIINQVQQVYIYNNSLHSINAKGNIKVLGNGINIGIAKAQNILINIAIKDGYDFALLSDQDTIYPQFYFNNIYKHLINNELAVVVCPAWSNINSNVLFNGFHIIKNDKIYHVTNSIELTEISHSISSGMVVKLSLINKIGYFNEDLFIDWVDYEWCWRIIEKGYKILGDPNIIIEHNLGDSSVIILCRRFTKRGSIRNYYNIRNAVYLLFHTKKSFYSSYLLKKIFHHFIFSILASENKLYEFNILLKAIIHGYKKQLGKISI